MSSLRLRVIVTRSVLLVLVLILPLLSSTLISNTKRGKSLRSQVKVQGQSSLTNNNTSSSSVSHFDVKKTPLFGFSADAVVPVVQDRSLKAESRGYGGGHGNGWGWGQQHVHYYQEHNDNSDLYSLIGGLSFAGLLGATIIWLARRNTSGRRRRSIDSIFEDEDDDTTQNLILDAIEYKY